MKALLFALLLVAFVCKDPVKSLKCYETDPFRKKTCSETDRFCFILQTILGKQRAPRRKGCAPVCVVGGYVVEISCCKTDFCNV
ncbi:three-fingered toxin-32 [Crotalus adamanteus]|uniref:Three-fingered toxin-32 n=1 Tax=Crotalus adamanteus TaxID=8729 RepID=A0AAW1BM20_CROAD